MPCTPIHLSDTLIPAPFVGCRGARPPGRLDTGPGGFVASGSATLPKPPDAHPPRTVWWLPCARVVGPVSTGTDSGMVLGARLREARTAIGLTQDNVATAVGIPRSAVSDIETGKRSVTGLELRRLARLYRRPVQWLLGDDDPPVSDEIIAAITALADHDQTAVLGFARFLARQAVMS